MLLPIGTGGEPQTVHTFGGTTKNPQCVLVSRSSVAIKKVRSSRPAPCKNRGLGGVRRWRCGRSGSMASLNAAASHSGDRKMCVEQVLIDRVPLRRDFFGGRDWMR